MSINAKLVVTLHLEQLVNNTPPASINSNILSVLKVFSPKTKVIDLPHVNTIRKGITVFGLVCHMLAIFRLAKSKYWKQMYTNGTLRLQSQITNLVIDQQDDDVGKLVSILLTANIIPENKSPETACDSIMEAVKQKGQLLTKWSNMHEFLFEYNHNIPLAEGFTLTNLANCGVITTDTCNAARKTA